MLKGKINAVAASCDLECTTDENVDTVATLKRSLNQFARDFSLVLVSVICASLIVWKVLASPDIDALAKSLTAEAQDRFGRETSFLEQRNQEPGKSVITAPKTYYSSHHY